jgi:hypothetical protein
MMTNEQTAVQLDELDYLRLVLKRSHVQSAQLARQDADRAELSARRVFEDALAEAGTKYGFDATASHRMDDDTHRLIPE